MPALKRLAGRTTKNSKFTEIGFRERLHNGEVKGIFYNL